MGRIHNLLEQLWDALGDLASRLVKVLFVPSNAAMGKASIKVCLAWDMDKSMSKSMNLTIEGVMLKINLIFGIFFGACSTSNKYAHFARDCKSTTHIIPSSVNDKRKDKIDIVPPSL